MTGTTRAMTAMTAALTLAMAGASAAHAQAQPRKTASVARTLPLGEYACYGSGQRVLIGLGFKLLGGGVYTDLDAKSRGRYAIAGSTVRFTGGHLDGQTGRDIKNNGFTIGAMASCQKW